MPVMGNTGTWGGRPSSPMVRDSRPHATWEAEPRPWEPLAALAGSSRQRPLAHQLAVQGAGAGRQLHGPLELKPGDPVGRLVPGLKGTCVLSRTHWTWGCIPAAGTVLKGLPFSVH